MCTMPFATQCTDACRLLHHSVNPRLLSYGICSDVLTWQASCSARPYPEDGTVKIWDLRAGGYQREYESRGAVTTVVRPAIV